MREVLELFFAFAKINHIRIIEVASELNYSVLLRKRQRFKNFAVFPIFKAILDYIAFYQGGGGSRTLCPNFSRVFLGGSARFL